MEPVSSPRATARSIQERYADAVADITAMCPDVSTDCLEVDLSGYPEAVDLSTTALSYRDELGFIIQRLNAQIWIERTRNALLRVDLFLERGNVTRAKAALDRAEAALGKAALLHSEHLDSLVERLRNTIAGKRHALSEQRSSPGPKRAPD